MRINAKQARSPLFLLSLLTCMVAGGVYGGSACEFQKRATIEIVRDQATVAVFAVSLADTPQRRRRGLMHCPALSPETGMLFVYPTPGKRVFWMKNTIIELAIIFISADGRVSAIARGEPGSLARIRSPENTRLVLEVNYAESRQLAVGDRVRWRPTPGADDHPHS